MQSNTKGFLSFSTEETSYIVVFLKYTHPLDNLKQEVERIGVFFEDRKMTPIESRVFALLLLSDPPYLDFYSIQEFLQASKSSISNAINRLINAGRVDYLTKPGDRKRYFRVNMDKWLQTMKTELASVGPFVEIIDQIAKNRSEMAPTPFDDDLQRVRRFFAFMADEFPRMVAKWEHADKQRRV